MPYQADTVLASVPICDDSRFLSKLHLPYPVGATAAAVSYSFDNGLLRFQTKSGLRRLYISASHRVESLRTVHDDVLAGHGGVNTTGKRFDSSFGG